MEGYRGAGGNPATFAQQLRPAEYSRDVLPLDPAKMPQPPAGMLDHDEMQVWFAVMKTRNSETLQDDIFPVLVEYCRAVINAQKIAQDMREVKDRRSKEGREEWFFLLGKQRGIGKHLSELAVKLRLCPTARYTSVVAEIRSRMPHAPERARKPWEPKAA